VPPGSSELFPGYRFAHPQIAWVLYQEWTPHYASLAVSWARDLAASLARCRSNPYQAPFTAQALWRLGNTCRLADAHSHQHIGLLQEAIAELYGKWDIDLRVSHLPRWLNYLYRWSDLTLTPDPVQLAIDACSGSPPPANAHPSVAGWLWRLSDTPRFAKRAEEMRRTAQSLLLGDPTRPGTGACLMMILVMTSDPKAAACFVKRCIDRFPGTPEALQPLCALVANHPGDSDVLAAALAWVKANRKHDKAYQLLEVLVAHHSKNDEVLAAALTWNEDNPQHHKADQVLSSLVANRPQDDKVLAAALTWNENNPQHHKAYQVLTPLVANRPQDDKVLAWALDWIRDNWQHDKAYWFLNALVAAHPKNHTVLAAALAWIKFSVNHDKAYQLLATLVARCLYSGKVAEAARNWWTSNYETHPNAYRLLVSLITRSDGKREWMSAGMAWFSADFRKGKIQVLAAMISASKAAKKYLDIALSQLGQVEGKEWRFLRFQLSNALANNVPAAVKYLRGRSDAEDKLRIAASFAVGLSRHAKRAAEFVEHLSATPAIYQGPLLAACIRSKEYGASLESVVEGWLAANYGGLGYIDVLRALKGDPVLWQELLERNCLSPQIITDFNKQGDSVSVKGEANVNMRRPAGAQKQSRRNRRKRAKQVSRPESELQ